MKDAKKVFFARHPSGHSAEPFNEDLDVRTGSRFSFGDILVTITSAAGDVTKVGETLTPPSPVADKLPFHLGYVENTDSLCKVIIKPELIYSDDTDVIVLDIPFSQGLYEHILLIGYNSLETVSKDIVDFLCVDPFSPKVKIHKTILKTLEGWIVNKETDYNKPFSSVVAHGNRDESFIGLPAGDVPLSYSYINGRKVYKASIIGYITGMTDSWRLLCDTITFMNKDEIMLIYISSGGGDTQTASSVIAAISQTAGTVVTIACGACASAAPVIWSKGHIRLVTDNASMMVHNIAVADPSTKTTSHIADLGDFSTLVAAMFLKKTVGAVGLATDEEIKTIITCSRDYYHSAEESRKRTNAILISSDRDIWKVVTEKLDV